MGRKVFYAIKLMFQASVFYTGLKIVLVVITALSAPVTIFVTQRLLESIGTAERHLQGIICIGFWIGALAVIHIWDLIQGHAGNLLQLILLRKLKEKLLPAMADKANAIAYEHFEDSATKDIFHRLDNAPHEMVWNVFEQALNLARLMISVVGFMFVFARVSIWFLLVFIFVLIPTFLFDYKSVSTISKMHHSQTFAERELAYYEGLLEDKYALHELKVMNGIDHVHKKWKSKADIVLKNYMSTTLKSQLIQFGSMLLLFFFAAGIIGILVRDLYWGNIAVSTFVALANAIQSMNSASYDMAWYLSRLGRNGDQMDYFQKLFALPDEMRGTNEIPEMRDENDMSGNREKKNYGKGNPRKESTNRNEGNGDSYEISFENVSFSYPGTEKQILSDLTFRVKPGEKVCIVGRNGAGKSTIIKLLCGLYQPDSGTIRINGMDIRELSPVQLKKVRSIVFQDFYKFHSSVRENVAYSELARMKDDEAVWTALKNGMIDDYVESLEKKLDTNLGTIAEDGVDLSGGQWQKLALARACFAKSKFLILDEPTAALDPMAESRMYHMFAEILADYGYIFISHRLASAKMAQRILVLENGELVEDGSHNQLMEKKGLYWSMFTEQSSWYVEGAERMVEV